MQERVFYHELSFPKRSTLMNEKLCEQLEAELDIALGCLDVLGDVLSKKMPEADSELYFAEKTTVHVRLATS